MLYCRARPRPGELSHPTPLLLYVQSLPSAPTPTTRPSVTRPRPTSRPDDDPASSASYGGHNWRQIAVSTSSAWSLKIIRGCWHPLLLPTHQSAAKLCAAPKPLRVMAAGIVHFRWSSVTAALRAAGSIGHASLSGHRRQDQDKTRAAWRRHCCVTVTLPVWATSGGWQVVDGRDRCHCHCL